MGIAWSVEQVLALAPDEGSVKSGQNLAHPRKWALIGTNGACAWGEIQGSGKDPYQTCIDLGEPAFKCTCPSRKFPCKHSLALFLILAQQPSALTATEAPAWVVEWLAKRAQNAEKKAAKASAAPAPRDPEAEANATAAAEKRAAAREAKITAGLRELETWLCDLVRSGFASLPGKPSSFWENPAARLVDAQAPGLARWVRELDGITTTGEDWPQRLLAKMALLHLACEAWARRETLSATTQADLRTVLGLTEKQEEILGQAGVNDLWLVWDQRIEEEDRLRVQRTWLYGVNTQKPALCLSFAVGNQPLDTSLVAGTVLDADIVFFPSAWPLRALIKHRRDGARQITKEIAHFPLSTIMDAARFIAEVFTANPWLERVPLALAGVRPIRHEPLWLVRDQEGKTLPLEVNADQGWRLLAISGGHSVALIGEWDGAALRPLSVFTEGRLLRL